MLINPEPQALGLERYDLRVDPHSMSELHIGNVFRHQIYRCQYRSNKENVRFYSGNVQSQFRSSSFELLVQAIPDKYPTL